MFEVLSALGDGILGGGKLILRYESWGIIEVAIKTRLSGVRKTSFYSETCLYRII